MKMYKPTLSSYLLVLGFTLVFLPACTTTPSLTIKTASGPDDLDAVISSDQRLRFNKGVLIKAGYFYNTNTDSEAVNQSLQNFSHQIADALDTHLGQQNIPVVVVKSTPEDNKPAINNIVYFQENEADAIIDITASRYDKRSRDQILVRIRSSMLESVELLDGDTLFTTRSGPRMVFNADYGDELMAEYIVKKYFQHFRDQALLN